MKTFKDAAESYIENGGDNRYLPRIIERIGEIPLSELYPFDIKKMAKELYPTQENSTVNRHVLTPVRSVFIHGYERGWCNYIKIKSFKESKPKRKVPASLLWLHSFLRQCDKDNLPHVAALVLFMNQTGARVSEAVNLRWSEVDLINRKALLLKTKTEENSERYLTDELIGRMYKLKEGTSDEDHTFRFKCRYSVNERIEAVCKRADITYKSSHVCGRHSFATNAIDLGVDVKTAMEAGGWKSSNVFLETYVHSRVNSGRVLADRLNMNSYNSSV